MKLPSSTGLIQPGAQLQPDRRSYSSRERVLDRVRSEFAEMPCMSLTVAQSVRLFGLRPDVCGRVLETLVSERVLYKRADGRYAPTTNGI